MSHSSLPRAHTMTWIIKAMSLVLLIACVLMAKEARGQQPPPPPAEAIVSPQAPPIHEVHRAALSHYGLRDTAHTQKLKRRVRRANLLPDIELRSAWRRQDDDEQDYREDLDFDDLGFATQDSARHDAKISEMRQNTYTLSVRFKLSGLIFDPRELDVMRVDGQLLQRKERLLTLINARYYEREHVMARLRELDLDDEERLLHQTQLAQCEADLDAFTGNWFTQHMEGQSDEK